MIERLMAEVGDDDAGGLLAVPVADTLKLCDEQGRVRQTVPRDGLWQAQTPQMFRHRLLLDALDFAPQVTDEASAIESLGLTPKLVAADISNLKVTYPQDLKLAEWILRCRQATPPGAAHG
jgi:2-C-methyl-D-erythritol 4-phosphate cytidylyltransferase